MNVSARKILRCVAIVAALNSAVDAAARCVAGHAESLRNSMLAWMQQLTRILAVELGPPPQ